MKYRLDPQPLEWIDRTNRVSFRFEGQSFQGYAGDSISAALLASGQSLLGRSFKYHRPRGVLTLANHDINALFQSPEATNIRGDVEPVTEGLSLEACNVNGTLAKDRDRFIGLFARFMPVGFYYKAFHRPKHLFPFWERKIREKAGLGRVDTGWAAQRQSKRYDFCDLLVVGAGASGMQAALTAAQAGADVVLVDENPHLGGSLDYQLVNESAAAEVRASLKQSVRDHANIRVFQQQYAAGWYTDHYIPLVGPKGITKLRARGMICATGVMEQLAVFRNNDLPGIMMASAAQRLIARYAVQPGHCAVVLCANDEGYRAALDLLIAGIEVAAVVDLERKAERGYWAQQVVDRGVLVYRGYAVYEAQGKQRLQAVQVAPFNGRNCNPSESVTIACDLLLMSVGWAPAAQLLYQAQGKLAYDATLHQLLPRELPAGIHACGRLNGAFTLEQRLADGKRAAGAALAGLAGLPTHSDLRAHRDHQAHSHPWPIVAHPAGKNFVDMDEDLQLKDLINAAREGFDNIELMKRFSTIGMGPSQGKHANMNGIRILAALREQTIDETGSTTARPMVHPVPVSALAGRGFRPERRTPMHEWHLAHGAQMMESGHWKRPEYYGPVAEREQAILSEAQAVRKSLGLIDVATLGKFEILGPDAAQLLDVVYTMKMSTIKVGMTRYALLVDDSGVIIDDGIVARLGEDRFYVSATTSHAATTFRILSQTVMDLGLDVRLVNRTDALAAMNLAGPLSRQLLNTLVDTDLSEDSFPFLGIREAALFGTPVRLIRVGFVGELGYEIHAPARVALDIWRLLMSSGATYGIRPFGVEAQRTLRLEKGHIIVGQDTDGLTNPFETNMAWAVPLKSKPWFMGKPSLALLKERCHRQLTGFVLERGYRGEPIRECHLVIEAGEIVGRVTSIAFSPALGRYIGLAMVNLPLAIEATTLRVRVDSGALVPVSTCKPPFYDADGTRQTADLTEVA